MIKVNFVVRRMGAECHLAPTTNRGLERALEVNGSSRGSIKHRRYQRGVGFTALDRDGSLPHRRHAVGKIQRAKNSAGPARNTQAVKSCRGENGRIGHAGRDFLQAGVHVAANFGETCLRKRSEEHTSELQSQSNLVCRLLLEK